MSKMTIARRWILPLGALCLPACTFHASVSTGAKSTPAEPAAASAAGSPEGTPEEPAAAAPAETPAVATANVKVTGNRLTAQGPIVFQADSATFQPDAGNEAVLSDLKLYLDQTARVTLLRIEGHTHNLRPEDESVQLSGQRAAAVKHWLRQAGINEGRLLAVGFGQAKPIASNADAAGQAQNERIAFRIAELDGRPYMGTDPMAGGQEFQ